VRRASRKKKGPEFVTRAEFEERIRQLKRAERRGDSDRPLTGYPMNLRADQVATYLNCSEKHVRELAKAGVFGTVADVASPGAPRKAIRIKRAALANFAKGETE
jgi:hypothetical protein